MRIAVPKWFFKISNALYPLLTKGFKKIGVFWHSDMPKTKNTDTTDRVVVRSDLSGLRVMCVMFFFL